MGYLIVLMVIFGFLMSGVWQSLAPTSSSGGSAPTASASPSPSGSGSPAASATVRPSASGVPL